MEDLDLLENKIYSMSNSFLPLDMFFNDIRLSKADYYDKERAYKDIEIIADFIIDLQSQLNQQKAMWETLKRNVDKFADKQLAIQELEKVKVNLKDRITMMSSEEHSYLQKVVSWYDICNQVNKQIKELKGKKDE